MKFPVIFLTLLTTLTTQQVTAIPCECTISNVLWAHFRFIPTCTVKSNLNIVNDNTTITSINGNCETAEPNPEVRFFQVRSKTVYYIPKGLDQVFLNLTGLKFELTKLKHVTKENLKPFPHLVMFMSVSNQVQFLEKDLFIHNTKLEFVSFRLNKITFIDSTVFSTIRTSLVQLFIDGTAIPCGLVAAINPVGVERVLKKLESSACSDINNAPPLYSWWIKAVEGGSGGGGCEAEVAAKEAECTAEIDRINEENKKKLECALTPSSANCPKMM